jgi:glycosyltransferase involved in cell wall biosynthesis
MRICLLTYRGNMYCGGQGVYVYYLARALRDLGHEVDIISGPPYVRPPDGVAVHELEGLNLYETDGVSNLSHPLRMLTPLNLYEAAAVHIGFFPDIFTFSVRAYWKLRDLMAERRFDVIHDNQTLGYGLLLMKTLGVPIVATIHHPITVDLAASVEESKTWRRRLRWALFYSFLTMQARVGRRMDRVISVSAASGEDTIRDFKLRPERVRTVHNGIDTDIFRRLEEVERVPNRLVIVGKVRDRTKGVPFLLEAVRMLRGDVDLDVRVVGDQGPDDYAERLVSELGIGDMVTFARRRSTRDSGCPRPKRCPAAPP